mgnify:CR=1 FL=1
MSRTRKPSPPAPSAAPVGDAGAAPRPRRPEDVEILLYDFRGEAALPDGPVAEAWQDAYQARARALMRDLLVFHHESFGRLSYDGAGARVALFLDVTRKGGWSDPYLCYLSFSRETPLPGDDIRRRFHFGDFALAADYVGHEFQHLVTSRCAALTAPGEPLALNESLSDVFGLAFRHWRALRAGAPDTPEWRFGEGTARPPLSCTRNLAHPGDMAAWNTGVSHMGEAGRASTAYALSFIPSLAFRLAAKALGERILDVIAVWNAALADPRMGDVRGFGAFADLTVAAAERVSPEVGGAVRGGWGQVGVATTRPLIA